MDPGGYRFERFLLRPGDRRLTRDGAPVALNSRYLDVLALLVREHGRLVSKDRFLDEVWRGVPVTDEALTQCVRTLRRRLGDDATRPRFIETVPKHGYRFIAPVEPVEPVEPEPGPGARAAPAARPWRRVLLPGAAGTLGGGLAGALGGLAYGFAAAQPLPGGMGAASVLLVLACLSILVGAIGGAGVGFGIAAATAAPGRPWPWSLAGGALGGLVVGALVKLVGLDAFVLLFGRAPGDITGAAEGALLGAATGLALWLGRRPGLTPRGGVAAAGLVGAAAGVLVALAGGRLMGGSLDRLARHFPDSRLSFERIGALFGETGFGPISQAVTAGFEGALFCACVAGAMLVARRRLGAPKA